MQSCIQYHGVLGMSAGNDRLNRLFFPLPLTKSSEIKPEIKASDKTWQSLAENEILNERKGRDEDGTKKKTWTKSL